MTRHRRTRTTPGTRLGLATTGLLAGTLLLAPTASAATTGDGLWYFTDTGIAEAQQVATGSGVTIALIDSEINPRVPDLAGTNLTVKEPSYCAAGDGGAPLPAVDTSERARHTTSMASLLIGTGTGFPGDPGVKGVAPGAGLTVYAQLHDDSCATSVPEIGGPNQAFADAVQDGADIIVVPGDTASSPDVTEAIRAGVVVIGAGGNDGGPVNGYPATQNGVIATGTSAPDGSLAEGSTFGPELGLVAPGASVRGIDPTYSYYGTTSGSSNSSVITAGVIALAMSAHPEATSNQILQAVVRTTDGAVHEPARDDQRGYGALDVRTLMTVDPTTFPDVNPFIRTDADAYPTAEDLGLVTEPDAEPSTEPTSTPAASDTATGDDRATEPEDGSNLLVTGVVAAGVLAVVAGAVAVVVVLRRRTATHASGSRDPDGPRTT